MAGRSRSLIAPSPVLYTAQDVARYCEVDLKTIHHWADAGKIAHYRTEGRHLRFRRNQLVRFLRLHGYPLPDELATARPTIFYAAEPILDDDVAKKLTARFFLQRFPNALAAVAHLFAVGPDVLVCSTTDLTWGGEPALRALKGEAEWIFVVLLGPPGSGADLELRPTDVGRLGTELTRALGLG